MNDVLTEDKQVNRNPLLKTLYLHPAKITVPNMLSSVVKTTLVPLFAEAEILWILIATFSPSR